MKNVIYDCISFGQISAKNRVETSTSQIHVLILLITGGVIGI